MTCTAWPALALVLGLTAVPGCARRGGPATAPAPPSAATASQPLLRTIAVDRLRSELSSIFATPALDALWAVKVQSIDSGEVFYELNAHRLVMPASNMKIVTMSVAAERLGWDYRFITTLETTGRVTNGTLDGDLVVVGHGDPTISDRGGSRTRVFEFWADRLREQGVTRIAGRIIGDDDAFDDRALGEGWAWDDLSAGYATAFGALQFNENVASVVIRARGEPGQPATVSLDPEGTGLTLTTNVTIASENAPPSLVVWRQPLDTHLEVTGTAPRAERDYVRTVAVDNPTQFYVNALRDTLIRKGIQVDGAALDIDDVGGHAGAAATNGTDAPARTVLYSHQSPPLSEMGVTFMKVSQNLFGETLLNTIGVQAGLEPCPPTATISTCRNRAITSGRRVYEQVLTAWGVAPGEFIVSDGSGLSRYNFVTAEMLVTVLRRMARDPKHAVNFEVTLPIMGRDGTLQRRMRNTQAEEIVHAKTGSIANVRALSGYLATGDGERLAFSIIANNFKAPSATVDAITEHAIERLVSWKP